MSASGLDTIDRTVQKTHEWLNGVMGCLGIRDRRLAYVALRAVLHALRDRLTVDAAASLGAQLPLLVRGIYYEGWHPSGKPLRLRHVEEFLALVEQEFGRDELMDPEDAARAVFHVLEQHIDPGENAKVVQSLPQPLRDLWGLPPEQRDT